MSLIHSAIFFISFAAYLFSALPSIYWRDAPEFQAIGFLLDIAHPAGSPLYAMFLKLFSFLPFGSIAFKATLVSSIFGAGLSLIIFCVICKFLEYLQKQSGLLSPGYIKSISFVSTLILSVSNALWQNSNMPEVYSVQNFFVALFILLLLKILNSSYPSKHSSQKFLLFSSVSFLFGLSLGAHAVLVFYLPFLILFLYRYWLRSVVDHKIIICSFLCFFFLLGFSHYLYLPIRSAQNPYYDWGDPETFSNLIRHTSDRKDAQNHFSLRASILPKQLKSYLAFYPNNFSVMGTILGLLGFAYLVIKKERKLLALLGMFFVPPFLFFIRFWGEASAFLPNFLVFTILVGVGFWVMLVKVQERLKDPRAKTLFMATICGLTGLQFLLLFSAHAVENNMVSNYWRPRRIMKDILYRLPPNAILFSSHTWFAFNYLQQGEGYRPDITIFSTTSFIAPTLFTKIEQGRFPNIVIPKVSSDRLGSSVLTENIYSHPVFWEPNVSFNHLVEEYLVPERFFFRINSRPSKIDLKTIRTYAEQMSEQIDSEYEVFNVEEGKFFSNIISGQGTFFLTRHQYAVARDHFKLAALLSPTTHQLNLLGVAYAQGQEYEDAELSFLKSISKDPDNHEAHTNVAEMFFSRGMFKASSSHFKNVLSIVPNHLHALYRLGEIHVALERKKEALIYFGRILEIDEYYQDAAKQIDLLLNQ